MARTSKCTKEQVLAILREVREGATVRSICKRNGFTEKTFYRWRARYGSDVPRSINDPETRRLEEEDRLLKELVADLFLQIRAAAREKAS